MTFPIFSLDERLFFVEFDVTQAGHLATFDADEVRVSGVSPLPFAEQFKTPDSVAKFGSSQQACFGHVVECAKSGGFIDARFGEMFGDFRMGQRRRGIGQQIQCRYTGWRRTEPGLPYDLSALGFFGERHIILSTSETVVANSNSEGKQRQLAIRCVGPKRPRKQQPQERAP